MNFLDEDNPCGQSLLKLVSRGSAILAELLRLSDNIPKVFLGSTADAKKYAPIIFDFEYLKNQDPIEEKIQANPDITDLDEGFKDNYMVLLERFYVLFDSIYKYYLDIQHLMDEINEAVFIQYTFENILQIQEGKQLLGESYFLYGCMLLLMDTLLPGPVRERIIISYFRYKGGTSTLSNLTEICKLTKSTGFIAAQFNSGVTKRPEKYPDELFSRFPVNKELVLTILSAIQDDDVYGQISAYPSPEHRSVALSNQAQIIYILLHFVPKALDKEFTKMRGIVDKHFADNWVLPYYMGYVVDLTIQWEHYNAAKTALTNTVNLENIREIVEKYQKKLESCTKKTKEYLFEGALTEEFVLDKIQNLIQLIREANVCIRWLILHRNTQNKKLNELINSSFSKDQIMTLLLYSSQFEFQLKKMFEELIDSKQQRWDEDKNSVLDKMTQLAEYFGGGGSLTGKVQPDQNFQQYFIEMKNQIESLNHSDTTFVGRKVQKLIKALEDVEQFQQITNNLQIKSYLAESRQNLKHMISTVNIKKQILVHLSQITDFAYAWQALKEFKDLMQSKIKNDPSSALLLRATFMKLSSILDAPMVRIVQANSLDTLSVSKYYSGELIKFVKHVLQIIPTSVFDLMEDLIDLLHNKLKKIPLKFNRSDLKDYAQYEERQKMASLTHQISVFTESILAMETYLIGVIEVDPKMILEDGIRKEVIRVICKILDKTLVFKGNVDEFETKMRKLSEVLENFKSAFEYIQDFINIYGIKIWQEEFNKLITKYTDLEANTFLSKKMALAELLDDDEYIPLATDPEGHNFMGRLASEILSLTDPRRAIFLDMMPAFYDLVSYKESFSMKTIWLIRKCIGVSGLQGIDNLFSFKIVDKMRRTLRFFKSEFTPEVKNTLNDLYKHVKHLDVIIENYKDTYQAVHSKKAFAKIFGALLGRIQEIGQMIILRGMICNILSTSGRVCSDKLFHSLVNTNNALINDLINRPPDTTPQSEEEKEEQENEENNVFGEINKLMSMFGLCDPVKKIYITSDPVENLPMLMFLFIHYYLPSFQVDKKLNILMKKKKEDQIDYFCLLLGTMCFLNQFHFSNTEIFLGLMAQHIKSGLFYSTQLKETKQQNEIRTEVGNHIMFLEEFIRYMGHTLEYAENYLPLALLSNKIVS